MIHTDEDDEFERIERENNLKGQPYHFEGVYVSASQRNQVLEEIAEFIKHDYVRQFERPWRDDLSDAIRGMKK